MASKLILDLSDVELKKTVGGWQNGERYRLDGADLLQESNDGSLAVFTLEGVEIGEGTEETGATEAEGSYPASKPAPGKPSVTIQK